MTESKPWYLSRTIWAAVVTIVVALSGLFGLNVDGLNEPALVDGLLQGVAAIAGVVALLGRLRAKARIG